MKAKLLTLIIFSYLISSPLFANCPSCNPCSRPCGPYETSCQCTDPNAYNNPCLPPAVYCEAFGNVGGRY